MKQCHHTTTHIRNTGQVLVSWTGILGCLHTPHNGVPTAIAATLHIDSTKLWSERNMKQPQAGLNNQLNGNDDVCQKSIDTDLVNGHWRMIS